MADTHEDDLHDETPGYKLAQPKQSIAAYQQMGSGSSSSSSSRATGRTFLMEEREYSSRAFVLSFTSTRPLSHRVVTIHHHPPSPHRVSSTLDSLSSWPTTAVNMNVAGLHDRQVPAPPPPSPQYVFSQTNALQVDLNELLQLLHDMVHAAGSPAAAAASPVATPPSTSASTSAVTPVQTPSDSLVLHLFEADLLTLEGHGGDGLCSAGPSQCPVAPTDAGDESLQRYKLSLGLGGGKDLSDPNDPRVAIIQSLTMEVPGRDAVTIDLSVPGSEKTLKDHPFKVKEGSRFTMVAAFKVQHEVLSGLRYVQIVKRKGIKVSKDSEMIGSYAPSTDKQPIYTKRFQEDEAPTGMLARGHYNAFSSFVDDDKKTHLEFEWSFDITKDW